jgi:muconolactone delta-isomerase
MSMKFMVSAGFRGSSEERRALIPQEQAHIKALMERGIVEALYISADQPHVWIVMQGESEELVLQELQSLPLYPYMQPEITLLV